MDLRDDCPGRRKRRVRPCPYFIVELRHLGVQFHVTALGAQSTMQADVYFTDADPNAIQSSGAQTPSPVTAGNTTTYGTTATTRFG